MKHYCRHKVRKSQAQPVRSNAGRAAYLITRLHRRPSCSLLIWTMENRIEVQLYGGQIRPTALPVDGLGMHANFAQSRPVVCGVGLSAIPLAPPSVTPSSPGPSPAKRAQKDHGPNWLPQEIAALIAAKREMYIQDLDTVDGRDLITLETSKWIWVSHLVNSAGFSPILRDGPTCKTKWNQIVPDYKRIADYHCRIGRNVPDYWELSPAERKAKGLPQVFAQDVYEAIHEWYGNRSMIQPPHVRDLLSPTDGNYRPPQLQVQQEYDGESELETDNPMDFPPPDQVQVTEENTPP